MKFTPLPPAMPSHHPIKPGLQNHAVAQLHISRVFGQKLVDPIEVTHFLGFTRGQKKGLVMKCGDSVAFFAHIMNFTFVQLKNLRDPGPQAFGFLTNSRAVSQELLDHVKSIFSMDRSSRLGGPGHHNLGSRPALWAIPVATWQWKIPEDFQLTRLLRVIESKKPLPLPTGALTPCSRF